MSRTRKKAAIPPPVSIETFLGGPKEVSESFRLGLGYESVSFDAVRRRVNREWAERCECNLLISPGRLLTEHQWLPKG